MLVRLLNKFAALLALAVASPLFLVVAVAVKVEDGGPVFFSQERLGFAGQKFKCLKFRTMFLDAEALLMQWKAEEHPNWIRYVESNFKLQNDPRVTRVGRLLRRTSLDEIPQLVNVLRGEMNLVGPRPLLEREVADYGDVSYALYTQMVPGLTGLWQVSGRSNTTFAERAALDCDYFRRRSLALDVHLMLKTVVVLFRRTGAY